MKNANENKLPGWVLAIAILLLLSAMVALTARAADVVLIWTEPGTRPTPATNAASGFRLEYSTRQMPVFNWETETNHISTNAWGSFTNGGGVVVRDVFFHTVTNVSPGVIRFRMFATNLWESPPAEIVTPARPNAPAFREIIVNIP